MNLWKKRKKKQVYHHMIHWWQCMHYRSKLNSGQNFLTWVNSQFPLSARSPNYSWIRARRQRKLRIKKYIQVTHFFSLEVVTNNLALVISVNTYLFLISARNGKQKVVRFMSWLNKLMDSIQTWRQRHWQQMHCGIHWNQKYHMCLARSTPTIF